MRPRGIIQLAIDLDLLVEEPEKVKREEFPTDTKNENRLLLFQKGIIVPWLDGEEVVLKWQYINLAFCWLRKDVSRDEWYAYSRVDISSF